jgi:hypothetical protein
MGMVRCKKKTVTWRLMQRYEAMKKSKGSGKSIISAARKVAGIIWHMLTQDIPFDPALMVDKRLLRKAESMRGKSIDKGDEKTLGGKPAECLSKAKSKKEASERLANLALKKTGVAGKRKKAG